jgi:hypothetical protein
MEVLFISESSEECIRLKKLPMKSLLYLLLLICLCSYEDSCSQSFTKITASPVTTTNADSRSVNWVDVNNDGWVDLLITNGPAGGQNNFLYINNGSGNFTAVIADPVVNDFSPSDGATCADADNDGDMDVFVVNWYNINNMFYSNTGNGSFTQVTTGDPVNDMGYSETASWGDYDNDGLLDLYVTNSAVALQNFLYHNEGNGTFVKITTGTQSTDQYHSRSVNWTDIDNDGDADLFVTNENGQNENIYRNDSAGVFTKLIAGPLLNNGGNTMSASWADIDNDGDLDVFLAQDVHTNALFRNDGNFNFTKMVNDTVSKTGGHSFSSAWSDIDNDGDVDLFVTNSFGTALYTNYLFTNDGAGNFTRITNVVVNDSDWTYGCAFGDYDNDGFEDLAAATCRFNNIDRPDLLYHNNGNSNNWLTITLKGTQSNKSAIGARIRVRAVINGAPVWQLREISAQSSYCGQNDIRAHFGLGNASVADTIYIYWPSGLQEYYVNQNAGQFVTFTEGQGTTGFNAAVKKNDLRCYPDPATGYLHIQLPLSFFPGDIVAIHDVHGRKIFETCVEKESAEFDLDLQQFRFQSGIHYITICSSNGSYSSKIILNR